MWVVAVDYLVLGADSSLRWHSPSCFALTTKATELSLQAATEVRWACLSLEAARAEAGKGPTEWCGAFM